MKYPWNTKTFMKAPNIEIFSVAVDLPIKSKKYSKTLE